MTGISCVVSHMVCFNHKADASDYCCTSELMRSNVSEIVLLSSKEATAVLPAGS